MAWWLSARLVQEIKKYNSANWLILTSTPLPMCCLTILSVKMLMNRSFRTTWQSSGPYWTSSCLISSRILTVSNISKHLIFVFHTATLVVHQCSPLRIINRFNLPSLQNTLSDNQSNNIISKLHGILKPFLLQRLKADVEHVLPPKEYVLYVPLSERQHGTYDAVLTGVLRGYLINGKENETGMKD